MTTGRQNILLIFALLALAWLGPTTTARADAEPTSTTVNIVSHPLTPTNAPADEYFGRFKLSNLGVRNIIHAFVIEGNSPLAMALQRTRMEEVNSALVDWGDKYPRDPWLERAVFGFTGVLATKGDVEADDFAVDLLLQASQRYRNTKYAKIALKKLQALQISSGVDSTLDSFEPPPVGEFLLLTIK